MKSPLLWICIIGIVVPALAACGDDDNSDATPTATPTASATATPENGDGDNADDTVYPDDERTGIPEVDVVIDAVLGGDTGAVQALIVPVEIECAVTPSGGIPQPPECSEGTPDGTIVEAFPVSGPEGRYVAAADAAVIAFSALLGSNPGLFSVFEVSTPDESPTWPNGDYSIVFAGQGDVRGVQVSVSSEGIVSINYAGGRTDPRMFTDPIPDDDFILPPLN